MVFNIVEAQGGTDMTPGLIDSYYIKLLNPIKALAIVEVWIRAMQTLAFPSPFCYRAVLSRSLFTVESTVEGLHCLFTQLAWQAAPGTDTSTQVCPRRLLCSEAEVCRRRAACYKDPFHWHFADCGDQESPSWTASARTSSCCSLPLTECMGMTGNKSIDLSF